MTDHRRQATGPPIDQGNPAADCRERRRCAADISNRLALEFPQMQLLGFKALFATVGSVAIRIPRSRPAVWDYHEGNEEHEGIREQSV